MDKVQSDMPTIKLYLALTAILVPLENVVKQPDIGDMSRMSVSRIKFAMLPYKFT